MTAERRYVGTGEAYAYGMANGGMIVNRTVINTYLNYFLINVFRINSGAVAAMFFLEGIWDIINDPLMGVLVDRTRTRWGKMRPWLLAAPLPMALATVALCAGPLLIQNTSESAISKIVYMVVSYTLWETFFTICDVPYWGMSASVSPSPGDRTRAITYARFISTFFGGIPQFIIPLLLDASTRPGGPDIRNIFFGIGLVSSIVGMGFFSLAGLFVKERVAQSSEEPTLRDCINCVVQNPPLRLLLLKDIVSALGGISSTFTTYFYLDVLGSASHAILVGIPSGITNLFAYTCLPLFKKYLKNDNKKIIYTSQISNAALSAAAYFVGMRRFASPAFMVVLMMIKQGLAELFNGVDTVIPTEMVAETVDYMEWTTGRRSEGVNFAAVSFVAKFSGVLARSLGAYLLGPIGYRTAPGSATVPQTQRTKQGIWFLFMAVPVAFRLLSLIPLAFYDLVGPKRERMLEELSAQRAQRAREAVEA